MCALFASEKGKRTQIKFVVMELVVGGRRALSV